MQGLPPLAQDIQREYNRLVEVATGVPQHVLTLKEIDGTRGKVSVADLIAYQIGWGKCLVRWYETGLQGESPQMPGEGFTSWDYIGIAQHFYNSYQYDSGVEQLKTFHQTVMCILGIVEIEAQTGNLDQLGVWQWCTLASGKQWPLSKWIRVNTASPYKRAAQLIKYYQKGSHL